MWLKSYRHLLNATIVYRKLKTNNNVEECEKFLADVVRIYLIIGLCSFVLSPFPASFSVKFGNIHMRCDIWKQINHRAAKPMKYAAREDFANIIICSLISLLTALNSHAH